MRKYGDAYFAVGEDGTFELFGTCYFYEPGYWEEVGRVTVPVSNLRFQTGPSQRKTAQFLDGIPFDGEDLGDWVVARANEELEEVTTSLEEVVELFRSGLSFSAQLGLLVLLGVRFLRTGEGALAHFQDSPPWEGVKTVLELAFARFPGLVLELAGAW